MLDKHTPGPWRSTVNEWGASVVDNGEQFICYIGSESSEDRANARLIAAAPELLEACERTAGILPELFSWDGDIEFQELLNAAISKARGEGDVG